MVLVSNVIFSDFYNFPVSFFLYCNLLYSFHFCYNFLTALNSLILIITPKMKRAAADGALILMSHYYLSSIIRDSSIY